MRQAGRKQMGLIPGGLSANLLQAEYLTPYLHQANQPVPRWLTVKSCT